MRWMGGGGGEESRSRPTNLKGAGVWGGGGGVLQI